MNPPKTVIQNYIFTKFKKCKLVKHGREINAECAICGDSKKTPGRKKRFNYDLNKNIWQCFNCGEKGRDFFSLVASYEKIPYSEAKKKFGQHFLQKDNIKSYFNHKSQQIEDEQNGKDFDIKMFLEEYCFKVTDNVKSLIQNTLKNRAIQEIDKKGVNQLDYPFYVCHKGPFQNEDYSKRLIIPFFKNNKIIYFQGRRLVDSIYPKYRNAPNPKQTVILNEEKFKFDQNIYAFEGFWEGFILEKYCGMNGTSFLGSFVKKGLIEILLERTEKYVVLCFDNDNAGRNATRKVLRELKGYNTRLKLFLWPKINIIDIAELWKKCKNPNEIKSFIGQHIGSFFQTNVHLRINNSSSE